MYNCGRFNIPEKEKKEKKGGHLNIKWRVHNKERRSGHINEIIQRRN